MSLRLIDLKALRTLVVVIEDGTMRAAARRLACTQSAVSMQIQRLEADLGVTLLVRGHGRVQATPAGQIAFEEAREMLARNEGLRARLTACDLGGRVRFGLNADLAPLMQQTWARFAERFPEVEMQVVSELSARLCRRLDHGRVDLALLTLEAGQGRGRLLRREPLVWVGAPGHRPDARACLALALGPDGACAFRSAATSALDRAGRAWRMAYEGQTFAALSAQVGLGLAVTVAVPSMLGAEHAVLNGPALGLPELPSVDLCLAYRAGTPSPATRRLAELIEADIGKTGPLTPACAGPVAPPGRS